MDYTIHLYTLSQLVHGEYVIVVVGVISEDPLSLGQQLFILSFTHAPTCLHIKRIATLSH